MLRTGFLFLALTIPVALGAQERSSQVGDGFDLSVGGYGVGIGNVPRLNGLRLNFRDSHLEAVNGLNLTLWKPNGPVGGTLNGVAVGLFYPYVDRMNGLGVGGVGVRTGGRASGVFAGGLAVLAEGGLHGVGMGGLAAVAGAHSWGLLAGGLAAFTGGDFTGAALGGLAVLVDRDLRGVALGGLALVATRDVTGIGLAGLGVAAGDRFRGVALAGGLLKAERFTGIGAAAYTDVDEQRGITIGIYNSADRLHGLQIGLLNRAGRRYLPFLNWGF